MSENEHDENSEETGADVAEVEEGAEEAGAEEAGAEEAGAEEAGAEEADSEEGEVVDAAPDEPEPEPIRALTEEEVAKLAELDEALAKFEGQKRWSDVIRTILAKADIVQEPGDKVDLLRQAGTMYIERSSNQAEAIKAFERVIELAPGDIEAITRLKEMYEKRRDWEKLIRTMQLEADLLDPADRPARFVEMAELATQRLRKPDICIDLWNKVLAEDPEHPEALAALANLHERARNWEPLAAVLEKLTEFDADKAMLQKLGMIYADKIGDDAGAVRAFKRLLIVEPGDRRAQEQLKRRYVALKAWDELEEFYSESEKWDELIRIFEREADGKETQQEDKIALLFRAAQLWLDKKGKADRAARAYEKILDTDENNLAAAEALSPIYEEANDARKLVAVYEVRLRHIEDPGARIALLRETGLLYEERLRSPDTAFEKYLEAFAVDPAQEVVREDVDRVAEAVDGWPRVIEAYGTAITNAELEDDEVELRMNFGQVLTRVEKVEEAIAQYRGVYDLRGDHAGAIAALGELYRQTEKYADLLEIYERRTELEQDPEQRRTIAYGMASLLENELGDAERAIEAYNGILGEYGHAEMDAFCALDRLYEGQERWSDFAGVLERRIDLGPDTDEELAALKFRLARALEKHLDDKPRAVELQREVLTIMPEHDGGRVALEELLDDEEVGVSAAQILEPIYEMRSDWEPLIRALRVLHAGNEDRHERLDYLVKIGEVYGGELGDADKCFLAFCEGLREAPDSENIIGRLELLAVEQEKFKELVALVSELAEGQEEPDLARALWLKAAQIHDTQLEDVDGAVGAYVKILDLDPGDLEVLTALEMLYRRTERWRDLVSVLRRRVEQSGDPTEQEELLGQMATIHDAALEEPAEATRIYKEVLELDPSSAGALAALDDLFERQELWTELADNVDRQLGMAEEEDRQIHLMLRLADLREKRMNAVEAAVEIHREVLDRQPDNEQATEALERLLEVDDHQVVISEILEPIYRSFSHFEKLIGVHEIQALHASSPDRRVELLHQIADLYEMALDNPQSAFESFARALTQDAANLSTQEQLERLARVTGGAEALAQVYEARVEGLEDAQLAASLHVKAAEIREEQLADHEGAIKHYQRVLELDDQHLEAATALERLFQLSERYEDLATIYLTKSDMLTSPDEQKEYLFRGAAIYEEILERPVDAIGVYDKVLEIDPEDHGALDKLIELYLRMSQWEQLLGVYTRKADVVMDPDEKKRLFVEMGAVYEQELKDVDKAIDTYQRILEIDPDDLTAIGRLDALYLGAENWQELLSVLEREADLATDPSEVISYRYRIADLWHHKLDDAIRAVDIYREILDVATDHEPTLNALEAMVTEGLEPVAAAGVLEPVYRGMGEFSKLIAVHEVQIAHEEDPLRQVELLHQVAELYEFQLDQTEHAFEAFARSLPLDNRHDMTLASVERLAENIGAWPKVTALYDLEIAKIREEAPDDVIDMALRTAMIYEVHVGDVDSAIERYKIVVEADLGHVQAIEALDRLYEGTERWAELADILGKEIHVASSPDDILTLQFRLGQVYQGYLGNVDEAIEQYREILAAAPEHSPSLSALELLFAEGIRPLVVGEILEPLYRMQEQWDRLLNVHEVQLNYQPDSYERVSMMHRIAEIAEERAADHQRAFEWMQRALLEDSAHDHSLAEVERLGGILDGWGQLANTYADTLANGSAAENSDAAENKVMVGKRLARVYEEELGDVARAEETFRFVLGVDVTDEDTLVALDRIYVEHGAHESLADVLKKRIASSDIPDELVELHHRLGHVLEDDLGRTEEAIATYNHVLGELEPEHGESIHALEDIYTRLQDWPNLFGAFEKELDVVVGDAPQADILAKMARLGNDQLGDFEKAIELWKRVLDLRGEDPEALSALGDIYAEQQNWADLVDVLDREVAIVEDDSLRVAIYADLGRIWYERLERDRNSLENWERVLDIDPTSADALFHMAEIHRAGTQYHELVDTLHRVIEVGAATLDDAALENVYMQLGFLYSGELQQPMDAVDAYTNVLEINPANFEAMDALEHIHREEAQWEEAIGVMERRADAMEEPQSKIDQLLVISKTWAERVEDPDSGTRAYQRILTVDPMHVFAFTQLEVLHREGMRWEDLIEMYIGRTESTEETAGRVGLLRKVADVYEKELDEAEQAYEALKIAWTEDFTDTETAAELERIAGATSAWNDLLTQANEALAQVTDPEVKIAICLSCARWYGQELGHPEYAIPYFQQILALDPNNVRAMQQMAELYRTTQQWDALAQVLGSLVDMTDDPSVKAETYVQMGDLATQQLGVPEQARGYYTKALDADPTSVPALEALERVYREAEQWPEHLDILHRKADALDDPDQVLLARLQVAEAFELRIGNIDKAIATYRQVIEADAHNVEGLKGLERLYAQTEAWQDLLEILETQFEIATTERDRINILTRLAGMWEEEFVKPDKAAERLEQVVEIDPTHVSSLNGLARMYRQLQKWDELINTYERHVSATPDRAEKIRIYKAIGETYGVELGDEDRSVDSYLNVLSINEDDVEALDALTRLYDKRGDHASALDMMEQLARLVQDPAQQVDLKYRMGRILDEQLGDRVSALDHYQTATDLDPGHLPSLEAMRLILVDSGDWLAASRILEREVEHTENGRVAAKLQVELGQIYEERLDEHDRAVEVFEQAYAKDSDNEEAALPLVDEYMKREEHQKAFPLLQMLVKRSGKREAEEQHRLSFMLGETAMKLEDLEEAIKALSKAYQLDSTHLPSLLALAGAHYASAEWDKAFKFYQMLLVHHRDSLDRDETTNIFFRLGVVKREQGERRKALNMFDKALEEDSHHRPTLEAVVGLYEAQNEWEQVIHFKKLILEVANDDEERFTLMVKVGDLWKGKVENQQKAIQSYVDASDIKPDDHRVLHKLLVCYQETKQWEKALEIIQAVADLDDRPSAKAKYLYTIAVITRDELKDAEAAVVKFNEALDIDPDNLKAFEAINKILTTKKDWKNLERAFRKMIHRVVGKGNIDLEFNLWHNLGIIYRDRQKNFESAAEAFRMASSHRPDDPTQHQILAELFTAIPERVNDAIEEHQWLLKQDPYRVDSYRALYKLYFDARAYDKAWCLASTLSFLQKADAEQQQFYTQYKQGDMIRPQSRLERNAWFGDLFHPDEDRYVAKIMELLAPAVHAAKSSTDKALNIHKLKPVDTANSTVTFVRTFGFVQQVLNIPIQPRLFLQQQQAGGLAHMTGSNPPAVIAGNTLLSGYTPQDLTFVIGRFLTYYLQEHFVRTLLTSHSELRMVLLAGLRIAEIGQPDPQVDAWAGQLLQHLNAASKDGLRQVCRKFVESGGSADVKRWMQTVELTGLRAGFLVCNDLETAARMIQALPPEGSADLPAKDKIKEIVLFSVSEQYFRLRETLGITIRV